MKFIYFALIAIFAANSLYSADTYQVNAEKSKVRWEGKKAIGGHNGTVGIKSGRLVFDGKELKGGEFVINMSTIVNEDLTDKGSNAKLVGHLKSDDFFNVEKYPEARFKITGVKPLFARKKTDHNYEVTGNLTIRDKTHSITFPALIKHRGNKVEAYSFIRIDRTKWDVRYNSGNFFKDLGDKAILDEVDFNVILHANEMPRAD